MENANPTQSIEQTLLPDWQIINRRNEEALFGLLRFEALLPSDIAVDHAKLVVRLGDLQRTLPMQAVRIQAKQQAGTVLRFHLVSQLVANGRIVLVSSLQWPNGESMQFPVKELGLRNSGSLTQSVREDLVEYGTPAILGGVLDSRMFPQAENRARAWFNHVTEIPDVPLSVEPAASAEAARLHLLRWGFALLNDVIPAATVRRFRAEYDAAIDAGKLPYQRGTSQRIQQAHRLPHGRKIWLDPTILQFLRDWFRDEPCACQTLLYVHGSEQKAHQDTIHLTAYPAGFMCGVWVALQDVQPGSGELFVLAGSHRTPRAMSADLRIKKVVNDDYSEFVKLDEWIEGIIGKGGFPTVTYRPKAGQVLVWHENLIHGGAPRLSRDIERHSIVSHYFARGCVAYYDSRGEGASLEALE
jgi:ectoine hydroxylase-related dioxygenase (phytanoyl-CoA dioxygenase family)